LRVALINLSFSSRSGTGRYAAELLARLPKLGLQVIRVSGFEGNPASAYYFASVMYASARVQALGSTHLIHLLNPYAALFTTRGKFVSTVHDTFPLEYGGLAGRLVFSMGATNIKRSAALIFNSSLTMSKTKRALGELEIPSQVIPLGVSEPFLRQETWHGDREGLAFVGLLRNAHKDPHSLMEIFKEIKRARSVRLHVFTSSREERYLASLCARHGLSIPRDVVPHFDRGDQELALRLSRSVALLHVVRSEGFGLPILEAVAAGTRALVPKGADLPQEVSKVATVGDAQQIVDQAVRSVDSPRPAPDWAISYAKGFSWDRTARETAEFYAKVLKEA